MTIFFVNTGRRARFSVPFPAYRRNADYDNKNGTARIPPVSGGGNRANDGAADARQNGNGAQGGAVVWRRGRPDTVPAHPRQLSSLPPRLLAALARFLWSVMIRLARRCQPVSILLFVVVAAFMGGFVAFGEKVTNMEPPVIDKPADAIVVLTGGQSRIQVALDLLKQKRGQRLLISGVHPTTNERTLQHATHADSSLFDCCVDLDRTALNTAGNAEESERWIRSNGYHRVIIVTNNYHIPRSILEMSSRMKDVEFIPYPVVASLRGDHSWVTQSDALRVLFFEYVKYLGAVVRIRTANLFGIDITAAAKGL
ncbi:MAG: YdcF family protein [Rhizobiales bacterium]|mgnify:CR=1 FL=1|nr:YdcF family protein [Hyphomicrobiales bacterium]OJY07070.1 MAG: hypothetical protein BGP07_19030 [Rhizobiales bacterium 63-22]